MIEMTPTRAAQVAARYFAGLWKMGIAFEASAEREAQRMLADHLQEAFTAIQQETVTALDDYLEHGRECILSHWQAGKPSPGGGYRVKYENQWYDANKLPPCACGLDAIRATLEKT